MANDALLSWCTRRLCKVRGFARLITPVRQRFARRYANSNDRWAVIKDYRGTHSFKLDRAAYMGSCIYWFGWHHKQELLFLESQVRADDVIVDVGANTGEFMVALAPRVCRGKVLCFEPQADVLRILKDNVEINNFSNVVVFPFGLSSSDETAHLYTSTETTQFGGLNEGLYTRYVTEERSTATGLAKFRPLDAVLHEEKIEQINWLKIDVEGAELSVLKGARETLIRSKPKILIELNEDTCRSAGYSVSDIHRYLEGLEYRGYQITAANKLVELQPAHFRDSLLNAVYSAP